MCRNKAVLAIFSTVLVFIVSGASAESAKHEALFDDANSAYEAGEYHRALELYERITEEGAWSGAVLYNLGNAYARSGSPDKALLSYRRASFFMPRDADLRANRSFLAKKMDVTEGEWGLYPMRSIGIMAENVTFQELGWILSAVFMMLAAMILLMPVSGRRRFLRKTFSFILLIVLLAGGYLAHLKYKLHGQAVFVKEHNAQVRYAPLEASTIFFTLPPGEPAAALRVENGWVRLRDVEGRTGWTEKDNVMFSKLEVKGR